MPEYRVACHSLSLWHSNRDWFPDRLSSAIDLGCGLGLLFAHWNDVGIDAYGLDLTGDCLHPNVRAKYGHKFVEATLWDMPLFPALFDLGVCADVMEHIPPEYVVPVFEHIFPQCSEVVFKIAHHLTNDLGGPPLHLTLHPADWWIARMREVSGDAELLGTVTRHSFEDSVIRWRAA
jgi:hypothetical protein